MKLSTYLAEKITEYGIDTVFGYQGSSVSHIIDSICTNQNIQFIETRHEQAAAFAANGYALAGSGIGVAVSCSGPGVTNLITGIADAWFDSIPCLFICGQVSTHELKTDPSMRQLGFQEMDVVPLVSSITKYAVTIRSAEKIAYELEKAFYLMREGRPGPVLLDIPHNIQGANIDPSTLEHFLVPEEVRQTGSSQDTQRIASILCKSKRPVILLGGGSRCLKEQPELLKFIENLGVPIVSSYRGKDVLDNRSNSYCGTLGVYGDRCANWAAKYCDFLLVLGSRLDGRQTGDGQDLFAPNATVVAVDVDLTELHHMPDRYSKINNNISSFVHDMMQCKCNPKCSKWLKLIKSWRLSYPDYKEYRLADGVNPNLLLNAISMYAPDEAIYSFDVGQNQLWGNTSVCVKSEQDLLQSCGLGTMGFALPAAIGGYYATHKTPICISGDGGFQMNLQELQTISYHNIPVKIVLLNNQSLGLIRIYQGKALQGRYFGSVDGFGSPDYHLLADAYGIPYIKIQNNCFDLVMKHALEHDGPCLIEVCVSPDSTNYPEPTYRSTIDNQSLELSEDEKRKLLEDLHAITNEEF